MQFSHQNDHVILSLTETQSHSKLPFKLVTVTISVFLSCDPIYLMLRTCLCAIRFPGSLTFCSGGAHGYDNDAESMHVSTDDSCTINQQ